MADKEEETNTTETIQPNFPSGRVKKIMKLDKDINKVNSEALFLVSCCTDLFLEFLAEKSACVVIEKKRKTVKLDHLRIAMKRHQPTSDFLLESFPEPPRSDAGESPTDRNRNRTAHKPAPEGTRRIDDFFHKSS